jgi:hypothetical protein
VMVFWTASFARSFFDPSFQAPTSINYALAIVGVSIGYDRVRGTISFKQDKE